MRLILKVLQFGVKDNSNEIIIEEGCTYKNQVSVLRNFDTKRLSSRLGIATIRYLNHALYAEWEWPGKVLPEFKLYPALGGHIDQFEKTDNGIKVIKKCYLDVLGISTTPNVDPGIKSLQEQLQLSQLVEKVLYKMPPYPKLPPMSQELQKTLNKLSKEGKNDVQKDN